MLGKLLDARDARDAQSSPNTQKRWGETRELATWEKRKEAENTEENRNQYRSRKDLWVLPYFLRKKNFHLLGKDKLSPLDWCKRIAAEGKEQAMNLLTWEVSAGLKTAVGGGGMLRKL